MALSKTAFSKRAEQLKRYEDSDTNLESVLPKIASERKVRFSAGCIFLAACAAGDKDEVLNMLNSGGADIDTANVDGLTALHQVIMIAQSHLAGLSSQFRERKKNFRFAFEIFIFLFGRSFASHFYKREVKKLK